MAWSSVLLFHLHKTHQDSFCFVWYGSWILLIWCEIHSQHRLTPEHQYLSRSDLFSATPSRCCFTNPIFDGRFHRRSFQTSLESLLRNCVIQHVASLINADSMLYWCCKVVFWRYIYSRGQCWIHFRFAGLGHSEVQNMSMCAGNGLPIEYSDWQPVSKTISWLAKQQWVRKWPGLFEMKSIQFPTLIWSLMSSAFYINLSYKSGWI